MKGNIFTLCASHLILLPNQFFSTFTVHLLQIYEKFSVIKVSTLFQLYLLDLKKPQNHWIWVNLISFKSLLWSTSLKVPSFHITRADYETSDCESRSLVSSRDLALFTSVSVSVKERRGVSHGVWGVLRQLGMNQPAAALTAGPQPA